MSEAAEAVETPEETPPEDMGNELMNDLAAKRYDEARELLRLFGMPFRQAETAGGAA